MLIKKEKKMLVLDRECSDYWPVIGKVGNFWHDS